VLFDLDEKKVLRCAVGRGYERSLIRGPVGRVMKEKIMLKTTGAIRAVKN